MENNSFASVNLTKIKTESFSSNEENPQLCRICISKSSVMMSIFGEDALWKKITFLADVNIEEGDNLPQQICMTCVKNTISACTFKIKCEEADKYFRRHELQRENKKPTEFIKYDHDDPECDARDDDNDTASVLSSEQTEDQNEHVEDENADGRNRWESGSCYMHDDWLKYEEVGNNGNNRLSSEYGNNYENVNYDDDDEYDSTWNPIIPEVEIITPPSPTFSPNYPQYPPTQELTSGNSEIFNGEMGNQCSICFKSFALKSILKHHVRTTHPEVSASFECFDCKKTYLSKRFLEKHIRRGRCIKRRKNQTRPIQCPDCNMGFQSGHHFGWHKRSGRCPKNPRGLSRNFVPVKLESADDTTEDEIEAKEENFKLSKGDRIYGRKLKGKVKRKGRSRIQLDSNKIALAKRLIAEDVTTSKLAKELQISRTYAWRLRRSLVCSNFLKRLKTNTTSRKEMNENSLEMMTAELQQQQQNIPINLSYTNENANELQSELSNNLDTKFPEPLLKKKKEANEGEETESAEEFLADSEKPENQYSNVTLTSGENKDDFSPKLLIPLNDSIESNSKTARMRSINDHQLERKPRKPNVFLTEEKYEQAKILVHNNVTTMELAKLLNVSQMSAWKLRDNIRKGIPMTFRKSLSLKSQLHQNNNNEMNEDTTYSLKSQKAEGTMSSLETGINLMKSPRIRSTDRIERDRYITNEILKIITEEKNIQYRRVSEKLAEKGINFSASSVCQKLKALGIHRRLKPSRSTIHGSMGLNIRKNTRSRRRMKQRTSSFSYNDEDTDEDEKSLSCNE